MLPDTLEKLHIAEPIWFLLLLLIPLLVWIRSKGKSQEPSFRFSTLSNVSISPKLGKERFLWIPLFLRYLSIILLIISIARPQFDRSTQTIRSSGVDIVLAVDLSASMLALDMSNEEMGEVTRLDVVKEVLRSFIDKRSHDRIGLVAFSVNPYLVSALTLDKEFLQRNLARLRVGLTEKTGTNIGSALSEGINRLKSLESKSKILILLTDGKDEPTPRYSPLIFADGASKEKIKVYTIAIGSNSRTQTYLFDPSTRDVMRYANGKPMVQVADYPLDKEILKKIASKTDGRFFEAKDKETLRSIYDEIDRLEKTDVELKVNSLFEELFHWPLALGLLTFFMEVFLARTIFLKIP